MGTMTYSSGRTFQNERGDWFAQWEEDTGTDEVVGPFTSEEDAAQVFLD